MNRSFFRITAATTLIVLAGIGPALAQSRQPSLREAATRSAATQTLAAPAKDSTGNGTAIGALVGAAGMGTYLAILWNRCGAGCENDLPGWAPYAAVGVGAAGGAAVGYLIDRSRNGSSRRLAVVPAVSRRERGARVAIRF
jgi:hypothetical protein